MWFSNSSNLAAVSFNGLFSLMFMHPQSCCKIRHEMQTSRLLCSLLWLKKGQPAWWTKCCVSPDNPRKYESESFSPVLYLFHGCLYWHILRSGSRSSGAKINLQTQVFTMSESLALICWIRPISLEVNNCFVLNEQMKKRGDIQMLWKKFFFSSKAVHIRWRRKLQGYIKCAGTGRPALVTMHHLLESGNPEVHWDLWCHLENFKSFCQALVYKPHLIKHMSDVPRSLAKIAACWCCRMMSYIFLFWSLKYI